MIGSGLFELSEGGKSLRTTTKLFVEHPNVVSMGGKMVSRHAKNSRMLF